MKVFATEEMRNISRYEDVRILMRCPVGDTSDVF